MFKNCDSVKNIVKYNKKNNDSIKISIEIVRSEENKRNEIK